MTPTILTDKSRLQEIYDLRVAAWSASDRSASVNKDKFPNGWSDEIDEGALHFVIFNEQNKIVASARLSLHNDIQELPYPSAFAIFDLPQGRPFAFYSRLVVSPDYRQNLFLKKLDQIRIQFLKDKQVPFAIVTCKDKRLKTIQALGFEVLGKTSIPYADIGDETALILFPENIK